MNNASERGKFRAWVGPVLAVVLTLTCGGSDSGGGGNTCQQVGTALCTKACACTDGPGCNMSQDGLSLTFDSEADCRGFFVTLACSDPNAAYNDAAACLTLVQAATCTGTGTEAAVVYPSDNACASPP